MAGYNHMVIMEKINKISDEEIEIAATREFKRTISKTKLLKQKKEIEDKLKLFD